MLKRLIDATYKNNIPEETWHLMNCQNLEGIVEALEEGLPVHKFVHTRMTHAQVEQIILGLREGVDVGFFANHKVSSIKMNLLREAFKAGETIPKRFLNPRISYTELAEYFMEEI